MSRGLGDVYKRQAFIGVDVIVGTRGETPEYFEQAYQFIDGLDVTQLHVFSYSERPGTQALKIEYVVSPEEKHQRSQRLLALSDQKTQAFYARHIGQTMPVLMEKSKAGAPMHGFTENYIRVEYGNIPWFHDCSHAYQPLIIGIMRNHYYNTSILFCQFKILFRILISHSLTKFFGRHMQQFQIFKHIIRQIAIKLTFYL